MLPLPHISTLFPYTTLFRSHFLKKVFSNIDIMEFSDEQITKHIKYYVDTFANYHETLREFFLNHNELRDRKSTRLNSSHVAISYAVFCLKKKKEYRESIRIR